MSASHDGPVPRAWAGQAQAAQTQARQPRFRQRATTLHGSVTAEFSLVLTMFLIMMCGLLELARVLYLFNTLQMVTARAASAAAHTDLHDAAALATVRQQAVFRDSAGGLALGAPVTDAHVRIDYLSLAGPDDDMLREIAAAALPACAVNNRLTCLRNPYDAACVRLVRARICDPADAGTCRSVAYRSVFTFMPLPLQLPTAPAIARAESLGAGPGAVPCP